MLLNAVFRKRRDKGYEYGMRVMWDLEQSSILVECLRERVALTEAGCRDASRYLRGLCLRPATVGKVTHRQDARKRRH